MGCCHTYPIAPGMAGLVFREEFTNIPTITDNGGVLVGSPAVDRGVTLNGTTQYISYPNKSLGYFPGTGFAVVRFTPQFNWDENVQRYFMRSISGVAIANSFAIVKQALAANYDIYAYFGTGYVVCGGANYSAFWVQGQENVLAVSWEGTSSAMWLNGNSLIVTDTAMSGNLLSGFYLGSNATTFFKGQIKSIRIGTKPITALDVPVLSVAS